MARSPNPENARKSSQRVVIVVVKRSNAMGYVQVRLPPSVHDTGTRLRIAYSVGFIPMLCQHIYVLDIVID